MPSTTTDGHLAGSRLQLSQIRPLGEHALQRSQRTNLDSKTGVSRPTGADASAVPTENFVRIASIEVPGIFDSLQSSRLSSFRCSTRCDLPSSRAPRSTEIMALRHQLTVVHRSRRPRLRFTSADRIPWAWFSHILPRWRSAVHVIKPETVIAWHRRGFRLFWTWKSQHRLGRPAVSHDVRALIREMSTANPCGAPLGFTAPEVGIAVSQFSIATGALRCTHGNWASLQGLETGISYSLRQESLIGGAIAQMTM